MLTIISSLLSETLPGSWFLLATPNLFSPFLFSVLLTEIAILPSSGPAFNLIEDSALLNKLDKTWEIFVLSASIINDSRMVLAFLSVVILYLPLLEVVIVDDLALPAGTTAVAVPISTMSSTSLLLTLNRILTSVFVIIVSLIVIFCSSAVSSINCSILNFSLLSLNE